MKIGSILENRKIEKRIAITPEIAKKYISLGFDVRLSKDYGTHLGIMDEEYKKIGVNFSSDDKEILNSNVIVQLGLLSDDKSSLLKEDQTLIGVLNPYDNKEKLSILKNKKIKVPECAIKVTSLKGSKKEIIPLVGENNNQVLRKLGYSLSNLENFKKKNIL